MLVPLSSGARSVLTRVAGCSLTGAWDWEPERLDEEEKEPKETLEEIEEAGEEERVLVVEGVEEIRMVGGKVELRLVLLVLLVVEISMLDMVGKGLED